jgi:hypothetical protein
VIDADGFLYIAGRPASDDDADPTGFLYALDDTGAQRWRAHLTQNPVGGPALAADGTIYVAAKEGLSAFSPEGELLWSFTPEDGAPAMDGPIVSPEGTIYYKSLSGLVAVAPDGNMRWQAPITRTMTHLTPHLGPNGDVVYWENFAFSTDNGEPYTAGMPEGAGRHYYPLVQVLTGANGEIYYQYDVLLAQEGEPDPNGASEDALMPEIVFDWSEHTWQGTDAGVTPAGRPWLLARPAVGGMGMGFYWGTPEGALSSKLSEVGMRGAHVLSVDRANTAYVCMDGYRIAPRCLAFGPDSNSALWRINLRGADAIAGAALAPGRLYVATWDGTLTAFGESATHR